MFISRVVRQMCAKSEILVKKSAPIAKQKPRKPSVSRGFIGAPDTIRTCDLQSRSLFIMLFMFLVVTKFLDI